MQPIWYFGLASIVALVLTDTFETPLVWLLYHLLPGLRACIRMRRSGS